MPRTCISMLGGILLACGAQAVAQSLDPVTATAYSNGTVSASSFDQGAIEASADLVQNRFDGVLTASSYGNLRLMSFEASAKGNRENGFQSYLGGFVTIRDQLFFESSSGNAEWLPFRLAIDGEAQGTELSLIPSKVDIEISFGSGRYRYLASKERDGKESLIVLLSPAPPVLRLTSFDRSGINGEIFVGPGGLTNPVVRLQARAENNAFVRGTFRFGELPAGISFMSASGKFLAGVNAVPEPATWALMIVGFASVGAAARRRTRAAARAGAGGVRLSVAGPSSARHLG